MSRREPVVTWVVYEKQTPGKPKMTLVCEQTEWSAMELAQPNRCVLIRAGITNEGEAERLARSGAVVVKVKVPRPKPVPPPAVDPSTSGPNLRHVAMGQS
jgi:hypothetical protein